MPPKNARPQPGGGRVIPLHRVTGALLLEAIDEARAAADHAYPEDADLASRYVFYGSNLEQRIRHLALMADL